MKKIFFLLFFTFTFQINLKAKPIDDLAALFSDERKREKIKSNWQNRNKMIHIEGELPQGFNKVFEALAPEVKDLTLHRSGFFEGEKKPPNLSACKSLEELSICYGFLSAFRISNLPNLRRIAMTSLELNDFRVENLPKLEAINLHHNELREIHLTNVPKLKRLILTENHFERFDPSPFPGLEELYLGKNRLTYFDGSTLEKLKMLGLTENSLTRLYIEGLTSLEKLFISFNKLSEKPTVPNGCELYFDPQKPTKVFED